MNMPNKKALEPHILVIDDDRRICDLVSRFLQEHGFVVMGAKSAAHAKDAMALFEFDALVVDVMMPGQTGMELTEELRAMGNDIPVLLLTALGEPEDRITGFESGADDYLPKPFEPMELVLRLKSILRRTRKASSKQTVFNIGRWYFDHTHDELVDNESKNIVRLTSVEANLLRALTSSLGEVIGREDLAKRCNLEAGERAIDVQVTRLRRKIEENTKSPRYLQTVRGQGYLLRAEYAG